jgi:hypothetical protein
MLAKAAASEIGPGLPFLNVGRGPGFKIVLLMARPSIFAKLFTVFWPDKNLDFSSEWHTGQGCQILLWRNLPKRVKSAE